MGIGADWSREDAPCATSPTIVGTGAVLERALDLLVAITERKLTSWLILLCAAMWGVVHRHHGFFVQAWVGRHGRPFELTKLDATRSSTERSSSVRIADAPRFTALGRWLR